MTEQKDRAAKLIAERENTAPFYSLTEIAKLVGANRSTLWRWTQQKEMQKRIKHYEKRREAEIKRDLRRYIQKKIKGLMDIVNGDDEIAANIAANRVCKIYDWSNDDSDDATFMLL